MVIWREWIKMTGMYVKHFDMEGRKSAVRPRKTVDEVLRKDTERKGTDRQVVHNCVTW